MTATRIAATVFALAPLTLAAQSALRVTDLKFSEPRVIGQLDMDKLKGQPYRMGWSPDGSQLYLQTTEGTFADANAGRTKIRHYLFSSSDGSKKDLQGPPDWFADYWNAKYGQTAPGAPNLRIEVRTDQRKQSATSAPMGGDLARGGVEGGGTSSAGAGTSAGDVAAAAAASQIQTVHTMVYKDQKIGEFVNSAIVPGLTYGWGPKGTNVIAFAALKSGKVVIMDDQGTTLEVEGSKDAVLPAWSPDGKRLVWLQRDGRKKYQLYTATVSGS